MSKTEKASNGLIVVNNEGGAIVDMSQVELVARLTHNSISIKALKEGDSIYFRADGELNDKEQTDETGAKKTDKAGNPQLITTLAITNAQTGEIGEVVIPVIAKKGFIEAMKMGALKGRFFAMKKGRSTGVGKANLWEIVEFKPKA